MTAQISSNESEVSFWKEKLEHPYFVSDRTLHAPLDRAWPWMEIKDGLAVVVEPKPHWACDSRVFNLTEQSYCNFQDWKGNGKRARFCRHALYDGRSVIERALAEAAQD